MYKETDWAPGRPQGGPPSSGKDGWSGQREPEDTHVSWKNAASEKCVRTSLVARWVRICPPTQGNGFGPWPRKIPRAKQQLSQQPQLASVCAQLLKPPGPRAGKPQPEPPVSLSASREAAAMRGPRTAAGGQLPLAATREGPRVATETRCS